MRRIRIEGYQPVVSVSVSQRQSFELDANIQTGTPIAPAQCTIAVSTEIKRSTPASSSTVRIQSLLIAGHSTKPSKPRTGPSIFAQSLPPCSETQCQIGRVNRNCASATGG